METGPYRLRAYNETTRTNPVAGQPDLGLVCFSIDVVAWDPAAVCCEQDIKTLKMVTGGWGGQPAAGARCRPGANTYLPTCLPTHPPTHPPKCLIPAALVLQRARLAGRPAHDVT